MSVRPDTAMILAAGLGTRMRPLTDWMPKPLIEVAGRTLIDRSLDIAEGAGVARAVVNLHYLGHMIGAHLEARAKPEILYSPEEPEILDTGGGIRQALPLLGTHPFFVLNSDAIFAGPNPLDILARAWDPGAADALMLLVPRARARAYQRPGDFFLSGQGHAPVRRGDEAMAPLVFTGAQIIAPSAFADTPEGPFSLNLVWDRLLAAGRLKAVTYPGTWVDVGTPPGIEAAAEALARAEPGA
ncbi:nucleotidyltransferase family protein [Thermohalobaculum xanthum]|nr:nucleotidyltransferase family protein [Thermohalobaculum xanthum]